MKRIITLVALLLIAIDIFAQTEGISYQAVIIGPDNLELPGVDSEGNYLPTTDITVKFSIIAPGSGAVEFTEEQETTTDEFGRINLIIGAGNYDRFEKIYWDGKPKSLKVEIDFKNGDGFVVLSIEKLTYVPYIQHRTIKASDSLIVDGNTELKGDLTVVNQPTNLGGTFNVNDGNRSNLSGDLNVDGETNLNNTLNVTGQSATNLSGALTVGEFNGTPDENAPTVLNGSLDVKGKSTFGALESQTLKVTDSTTLNGVVKIDTEEQIIIESRVHTGDINYTSTNDRTDQVIGDDPGKSIQNYPLLVQGSTQGIAIKIMGNRRNGNNFISFWDTSIIQAPGTQTATSPNMWGRIEGEVPSEFANDADYLFDQRSLDYDIFDGGFDVLSAGYDLAQALNNSVAAATSATACLGLGTCITSPIPSLVASSTANNVVAGIRLIGAGVGAGISISNKVRYNDKKDEFQGVTYASGAGDYAEYLLREDFNEKMTYGDLVGVKGGKISKTIIDADRVMVISRKPIVLGNMPESSKENEYEKVAFMGQVPVKVFGRVNVGDYIIPSGKNDGIGIAISPSKITSKNIKNIVGVAWTGSDNQFGFSLVNVAVGLNTDNLSPIVENLETKVSNQANEILILKNQIATILERLDFIEQGNEDVLAENKNLKDKVKSSNVQSIAKDNENLNIHQERAYEVLDVPNGEIVYFKLTKEDFELGIKMAEQQLIAAGVDLENNEEWQKLVNDPVYKNKVMQKMAKNFEKQMHYHKDLDKIETHKH